jgi:hypothetical protein
MSCCKTKNNKNTTNIIYRTLHQDIKTHFFCKTQTPLSAMYAKTTKKELSLEYLAYLVVSKLLSHDRLIYI